jgi:hypothetical protein
MQLSLVDVTGMLGIWYRLLAIGLLHRVRNGHLVLSMGKLFCKQTMRMPQEAGVRSPLSQSGNPLLLLHILTYSLELAS